MVLIYLRVPDAIIAWLSVSDNKWVILTLINLILLFLAASWKALRSCC